jgi:hypothetical protein
MKKQRQKTKNKNDHDLLIDKQLKENIKGFIDQLVTTPALQTVDKEFEVQQDIVSILVLHKITEGLIIDHGENFYAGYLSGCQQEQVDEIKQVLNHFLNDPADNSNAKKTNDILRQFVNKKHLMAYLIREIKWIGVSILSASYISSFVLIRSVFELLIGIATNQMGSMSERIKSIKFLSPDEQNDVKRIWNKLNAWAHPYGKWEKEICPVYYSTEPLYHPILYKECVEYLLFLTDIFLTIACERFKILPDEVKSSLDRLKFDLASEYLTKLPLFIRRLSTDK